MIDALVFGCDGDWDLAWGLLPGEDYIEGIVDNYDVDSHRVIHGGVYGGRRVNGKLYFVRFHQDVRDVTEEGVQKQFDQAKQLPKNATEKTVRRKRSFTKKQVEALVKDYQIEDLLMIASRDKRVVWDLQRLLYSVDTVVRWRAADALGQAARIIAEKDPGMISKLLQGLFTSLTDSAASSWGSLDAIGAIISNSPEQFSGFLPQLYHLTGDRKLLEGILRAFCVIGEKTPELFRKTAHQFVPLLQDKACEVRGLSAVLLGQIGFAKAKEPLAHLVEDSATVHLYERGEVLERTVGKIASKALQSL
jgi:hypothetical protein